MTTKSTKRNETDYTRGSHLADAAPAHAQPQDPAPAHAQPQDPSCRIKISGLSEEFPAVVVKRRTPASSPYSRYHTRYHRGSKIATETLHPKKLPVNTWLCFFIYGAATVAATMVWFLLDITVYSANISAGSAGLGIGLIILGAIIAAGIILAAVMILLSVHRAHKESTLDIVAAGICKTAIAMLIALVVWIVVMAFMASMA